MAKGRHLEVDPAGKPLTKGLLAELAGQPFAKGLRRAVIFGIAMSATVKGPSSKRFHVLLVDL